jgi:hypothetical protein
MPDDYTMGDLARQDIYPDERGFQPPVDPLNLPPEAYASLGGGDLGLLGSKGIAGLFNKPSWLQQAQDVTQKDVANYQTGGVPAVIGALAENSQPEQDLSGGFGGNIKGVKAPAVPGALAALDQYHPPFYSAVERAVEGAKQNVAPGQQWAGFLRNQPGVKPEEVETLGLGKLFEQPGALSKDAVLGEIAANKVNVGEVVKGKAEGLSDQQLARLDDLEEAMRGRTLTPVEQIEHRDLMLAENAAAGHGVMGATKFHQYTLPGGENYRETLLTLPTQDAAKSARMTELEQKLRNPADYDAPELNSMRQEYKQLADETRDSGTFKSSHFDEPNILAHIRTNDRVIDGKKTLFVEEVQSDWHQKGKREGYAEPSDMFWFRNKKSGNESRRFDTLEEAEAYRALYPMENVELQQGTHPGTGVPDAPFKTTWPDLAMKRIIREAAEKGYDKVAWTPGSVQADRYDLSKQVNSIGVTTRSDARTGQSAGRSAFIKLPDGHALSVGVGDNGIIDNVGASNRDWKGKHLEDVIGKEMAEKIMKAKNGDTFTGLDLKVGGEGMKGFYDEILPATVNKLVKKHGARVQQGELADVPRKSKTDPATDQLYQELTGEGPPTGPLMTGQKVHTLDITPSLRAAAMKGFPLFTAGGVAATGMMGDLAKQDDYQ